jgi:4'-phosphopantetheinyl transferase
LNPPAVTIEWPLPPANPPLAGNEIHVWATTLAVEPAILEKLMATLSPDEKQRASRFKFEYLRNRYIAGRGALRKIMARYVGEDAAGLRFEYLENGKPVSAQAFTSAGIHFNLAHTGDLALVAVTRMGPVGVDVECVRAIKNADELVARFFSKREDELFRRVSTEQKPAAFFNLWTRKEALLKATGEGITRSLNLVEVSFLPGEPARLLAISDDAKAAEAWRLKELAPAKGFAGAVAIQVGTSNIQHPTSNIQLGDAELVVKCWKWI